MSTTPVPSKDAARLNELLQSYLASREIGETSHAQRILSELCDCAFGLAIHYANGLSPRMDGFTDEYLQDLRCATLEAILDWKQERGEFHNALYWSVRKTTTRANRFRKQAQCLGSRSKAPFNIEAHFSVAQSFDKDDGKNLNNTDRFFEIADPKSVTHTDLTMLRLDITEALSHLPPQQQEVVVQHFGLNGNEPRTYREIAAAKGQNHTNVCYHLRQALKTLRHELQAYA